MSLALEFESKLGPTYVPRKPNWPNSSRPNNYGQCSTSLQPPPCANQFTNSHPSTNMRALPSNTQPTSYPIPTKTWDSECQNRLAKGLCFRCNEKFGPSHRCKSSSFALMELTENTQAEKQPNDADKVEEAPNDLAEISFHAFGQTQWHHYEAYRNFGQ